MSQYFDNGALPVRNSGDSNYWAVAYGSEKNGNIAFVQTSKGLGLQIHPVSIFEKNVSNFETIPIPPASDTKNGFMPKELYNKITTGDITVKDPETQEDSTLNAVLAKMWNKINGGA